MSAKDGFETTLLNLILNNTAIANIGDAGGLQPSSADGDLFIALFTVTPSDSADGTECAYTGYDRVAVTRNGTGWTVVGNNASNAVATSFPQNAGVTTEVAVAFAVCTGGDPEPSADDAILWGALTASLTIAPTDTPQFAIGDLDINCD